MFKNTRRSSAKDIIRNVVYIYKSVFLEKN